MDIFIIIAIMVVTIIMSARQAKKKQMEADAKRKAAPAMGKPAPVEDMFPEEEKNAIDRIPRKREYRSIDVEGASANIVACDSSVETAEPNEKGASHISIKNRSEAEKAFIYSEIFNRKY